MSGGRPTKLVRDGGSESYDPPPDLPLPGVLVPADAGSNAADDTGETGQESSYSNRRARRAALDAISGGGLVDEPGGDW